MTAAKQPNPNQPPAPEPSVVTGVQLMQGIGVRPAMGFWADAWSTVIKKPTAIFALAWLGLIAFFAVYAPVLASGHPLWAIDNTGNTSSPLWRNLAVLDLVLLLGTSAAILYTALGGPRKHWGVRAARAVGTIIVAVFIVAIAGLVQTYFVGLADEAGRRAQTVFARTGIAPELPTPFVRSPSAPLIIGLSVSLVVSLVAIALPIGSRRARITACILATILATWAVNARWVQPLERWDYLGAQQRGTITAATFTAVPWSPLQRESALQRSKPGTQFGPATGNPDPTSPGYRHSFILGTDAYGSDVLSQLLHASRLSISIGVVSTGIALLIGVTIGALMGYFGGWLDLFLFRVVEIFMAVPVLFLLIVVVAVVPDELRTTYFIMVIIGCFTWTGMARFTRAEFMKLRNQDFVQAAQATGLPLRSILFRHMLPNGVAPVLVDTSFAIGAAISVEATLSYLGLGPADSASWGKLLSSAINSEGQFKWWLAVFPGLAIFLTVLAYNLLGEALRDAIDPKLKKARV